MKHCNCNSQTDHGMMPHTVNMCDYAKRNSAFRTAHWTGENLQLTFMHISPCGDIGLEIHPDTEQFIRIESGNAMVYMGTCKERLDICFQLTAGEAVLIPKCYWHNVINTSSRLPLKVSSIYSPPEHPRGTIQRTQSDVPGNY